MCPGRCQEGQVRPLTSSKPGHWEPAKWLLLCWQRASLPAIMAINASAELFRSVAANFNKSCCNMTCSSAGSQICCRAGSLQNIQNVGAQCSFYYFKTWKANELFLPSQKLLLELSHFFFSLHLLKEPPPPMESYCLPEAELYFQNNKELGTGLSQKRKAAGEMSRVKRSRIR